MISSWIRPFMVGFGTGYFLAFILGFDVKGGEAADSGGLGSQSSRKKGQTDKSRSGQLWPAKESATAAYRGAAGDHW